MARPRPDRAVTGQLELPVDGPWCQRWRHRNHSWRHRSAGGFNPSFYRVEPVAEPVAKAFVVTHHYSASYPAAVRRFGLFQDADLVGVAIFAMPMNQAVLTNVFPGLRPATEALECSRFVLLDPVPANADSERCRGRCNLRRAVPAGAAPRVQP